MKKIILSSISVLATTVAAQAFDVTQDVDPAAVQADYPYKILGMAPGMTYEEIKTVAKDRDIGLYLKSGTYGIRMGAKSVSFDIEKKFDTTLFDNYRMYRNLPEYDRLTGNMSSPAAGSVATRISRSFRLPVDEAPSWDSVMAKLVESYGEPSYTDGDGNHWVHDAEGKKVEGDPETLADGCVIPSPGFDFMPAEDLDENYCSVEFTVSGQMGNIGLTAYFSLYDINLQMADIKSMSAQMEAEMNAEAKPTDLDL
jgi:hypothetical protein